MDLPTDIRERLRLELRVAMARERITGREVAELLGIAPQGFSRLISGSGACDTSALQQALFLIGYDVIVEVKKR